MRQVGTDQARKVLVPKIEYSLDQVLEVAFALTLEQYGTTPRLAANFGPDIVHSIRLTRIRNPRDDFYVILERAAVPPGLPSLGYMLMPGFEQLTFWLKDRLVDREDDALLILNASGLMRKVEQALISQERS